MIYDYCIVGGGIIGLATAVQLNRRVPGASIALLEKERWVATHQTGRNSGVIHSGIYYRPGSLKADLSRRGAEATKQFCRENGIPFETRGKLIVATDEREMSRMRMLAENAAQNGIDVEVIDSAEIARREPNVTGMGALFVPSTGIVDYSRICDALVAVFEAAGGETLLHTEVELIRESGDCVTIDTPGKSIRAKRLIACAGLQSDRVAMRSGIAIDHQIIPFRGEYYDVAPAKSDLVHHLIYPVPDPDLPFLGIHLTPMIDGGLTVGPNAVLGLAREKYNRLSFSLNDVASFAGFPGFWRVIGKNWRSAVSEARNSLFKSRYLAECQKYCPSLRAEDLTARDAGIRAQAVLRDGTLVHDFLFFKTDRMLHVLNAPSPGATSALPIADMIVMQAMGANDSNSRSLSYVS